MQKVHGVIRPFRACESGTDLMLPHFFGNYRWKKPVLYYSILWEPWAGGEASSFSNGASLQWCGETCLEHHWMAEADGSRTFSVPCLVREKERVTPFSCCSQPAVYTVFQPNRMHTPKVILHFVSAVDSMQRMLCCLYYYRLLLYTLSWLSANIKLD